MGAETSSVEWIEAIAVKAKVDTGTVEEVLAKYHIKPAPLKASPRRLRLCKIAFRGEKSGPSASGPINFSWAVDGPGLWVVASRGNNLAGKSTVLEIGKWMLRGAPSSYLQDDIRGWIHNAEAEFRIDDKRFLVEADVRDDGSKGRLARLAPNGRAVEFARFSTPAEFKAVMNDFMVNQLSLGRLVVWSEKAGAHGRAVDHEWPALSGALFVGTKYDSLFGETSQQGLAIRLMQMYLGLPWIPTLTEVKAAGNAVAAERVRIQKQIGERKERQSGRRAKLEVELEAARRRLSEVEPPETVRMAYVQVMSKLDAAYRALRELARKLTTSKANQDAAEEAFDQDRRDLQDFIEQREAYAVFNRLDPTSCPRCDHTITDERRRNERHSHQCSVCGERVKDEGEAKAQEAELAERVEASKKARDAARRTYRVLLEQETVARSEVSILERQAAELGLKLGRPEEREQRIRDVAALQGRLDELGAEQVEAQPDLDVLKREEQVLDACGKETVKKFKDLQDDLLEEVSREILTLAQRFGIEALSAVQLAGNATMPLTKGGRDTSYSRLTDGEKLRLKVATVIAILKVSERRGVGRHPGLMFIDSPGAQEMDRRDLDELLNGLASMVIDLPDFQVLLATAHLDAAKPHVTSNRLLEAKKGGKVW